MIPRDRAGRFGEAGRRFAIKCALGSLTDRARRGISGVLYLQSALAGLNSHPRSEAIGVSTPP